ncbi:hypothetical protein D3C73_866680 [compost metagenome]
MYVAAAHVFQCAGVSVRSHHLLHLGTGIELDLFIRRDRLKLLQPTAQGFLLTRIAAEVAVAKAKISIDLVFFDTFANDPGAEIADFEDGFQPGRADVTFDLLQIVADAGHHLPAVASGAAVAQMAAFQNSDIGDAPFRQLQRGVDAGEATADDHHVNVQIFFQRREAQIVLFGCRVIG